MRLSVNGQAHEVANAPHETLLSLLRERLSLTGTKPGCERGECGACTVLIDGELAYSCLTLAIACEGADVTTVEGLAPPGRLHPVQRAFIERDAAQCGFCTPGQLIAAVALLRSNPDPDDETIVAAMSGNLCRCGTYPKIVEAIRHVASSGAMRT